MPRDLDVPAKYLDGDRVIDGAGNAGTVRRCFNRTTREYYLKVIVLEGPLKGTWQPTYKYTPVLDHVDGEIANECERCGRPFKASVRVLETLGGVRLPREEYCRTCYPVGRRAERSRGQADYVGSLDHKTAHHSRDDGSGSPF
jgi:hypothetical protein